MSSLHSPTRESSSPIQEDEVDEYLYETLYWYKDILRKMDQKSASRGDRFSRACSRCSLPSPRQRFVSTGCGHTVCRDCSDWTDKCSICLSSSRFIPLVEDSNRSRDCSNCFNQSPHERAVFSQCGHSICRACAYQIKFDATITSLPITCPRCRKESEIVDLIEKVINNYEDDINMYAEIDDSSITPSSSVIVHVRTSSLRRLVRYVVRKLRKLFT